MLHHNKHVLPSHPPLIKEALCKRMELHRYCCCSGHRFHSWWTTMECHRLWTRVWRWVSWGTVVIVGHECWLRTATSSVWTSISNGMVLIKTSSKWPDVFSWALAVCNADTCIYINTIDITETLHLQKYTEFNSKLMTLHSPTNLTVSLSIDRNCDGFTGTSYSFLPTQPTGPIHLEL